jgi:hypothetical protein
MTPTCLVSTVFLLDLVCTSLFSIETPKLDAFSLSFAPLFLT